MSISYVQNGDTGLVARTLINQAIDGVNSGSFPYTGSAKITGSLSVTGSTTSTLGFTGSLQGTSSYTQTASYVATAQTASYFNGTVVSASYAQTASYVVTAQTASYYNGPSALPYQVYTVLLSYAGTFFVNQLQNYLCFAH